jgi:excinuclease ABC subunit C
MTRTTRQLSFTFDEQSEEFHGFGATRYRAVEDDVLGGLTEHRNTSELHQSVRGKVPRTPGVYGMVGKGGRLIYVGKAKCLRSRLMSYFRDSSDPKAGKIIRHTKWLLWEHQADEFAALLRELELIQRHRPRFNVQGIPGHRRYVYLCMGRGPAACAYLTREPTGKELAAYGPFVGRGRSQEAVRRFNIEFHLRDCPTTTSFHFAEQQELFDSDRNAKCLRYELGTCLGPCAGYCSTGQYGSAVQKARAFLEGKDVGVIDALRQEMMQHSSGFRFEQAATLRDRATLLEWLHDKLTFLRTARSKTSFVYPLVGADGECRWYLIHAGLVQAVVRQPKCLASATATMSMMKDVFANTYNRSTNLERCVDSVLLVTGWFRKRVEQRKALLSHRSASGRCSKVLKSVLHSTTLSGAVSFATEHQPCELIDVPG